MKMNVLILAVGLALLVGLVCGRPEEKYTTKYDNVDLDQILKSDRLMKNYINCIMDRGRCTSDGAELKRVLPDSLRTDCSKCSEKQKEGSKKVLRHLIKNKRKWFDELSAKYDPEGIYITKYREEFAKEGIILKILEPLYILKGSCYNASMYYFETMKTFTVIFTILVVAYVVVGRPQDQYTTKYDNIDIDRILKNERLLKNYVNCVLSKGKCSPEGSELKRLLPEAIKTDCLKCNDRQKQNTRKVLVYLGKNRRQYFDEVLAKFDGDRTYRNKYKSEFAKEGISV
ncbi:uncharacterized protein LOC109595898 [Aethina tumida]|uniref:uncharacterized protein LOC109595898 n=1 Tax=Aethina tumida TaxID=116153 RepID=UPI0021476AED|nr:uncharacterized protein LOC109595898 [Aethina tumida]